MAEVGCVSLTTSEDEMNALLDFYVDLDGPNWRIQDNWLEGDPCLNHWFGVICNVKAQIIGIHFFENALNGKVPDSLYDLKNLKHFAIFNGEREHEGNSNPNRNSLDTFPAALSFLFELEEINLIELDMRGGLPQDLTNLSKLRNLSVARNKLNGSLPKNDGWLLMSALESIELQDNSFTSTLPQQWVNSFPEL